MYVRVIAFIPGKTNRDLSQQPNSTLTQTTVSIAALASPHARCQQSFMPMISEENRKKYAEINANFYAAQKI